ncbi:hypothetical protein [Cytobacillus kochii]|uniref:hypothetical protein n=1 Tax=Cytobacillus kochii TaxID=859143 RepID=UPI0025A12838|nr:hypothetical protein [Cytobacillus kochii]MDM5205340.1 hypothetical protein [Cytobacillus kochii]
MLTDFARDVVQAFVDEWCEQNGHIGRNENKQNKDGALRELIIALHTRFNSDQKLVEYGAEYYTYRHLI